MSGVVTKEEPVKEPVKEPVTREAQLDLLGNPTVHTSEPSKPAKKEEPDRFSQFWNVYPKKKSKGDAERAWQRALKKTEAEKIIAAVRVFARQCEDKDPQFIKHPATWLNSESYLDPDLQPRQVVSTGPWYGTGGLQR